ncbi:uncharacterized protein AB9W97_009049 isoform 1-T4 [Spinachia spinachia]
MTTMRANDETRKWIKPPPNAPPPSARGFETNQRTCSEDYTTVYQSDFPEWKVQKCLPFKQANSFKVEQGLVLTGDPWTDRLQKAGAQGEANSKPVPPFERLTSYTLDYVNHPVQSTVRVKPVHDTRGLLAHPTAASKPKTAGEVNKDIFDKTRTSTAEVNNWSRENKLQGTCKPPKASQPAGRDPVRASRQATEGGEHPSWGTTTMKEDCICWKMPPFSSVREDPDWPKKASPCPTKPIRSQGERLGVLQRTKAHAGPGRAGPALSTEGGLWPMSPAK